MSNDQSGPDPDLAMFCDWLDDPEGNPECFVTVDGQWRERDVVEYMPVPSKEAREALPRIGPVKFERVEQDRDDPFLTLDQAALLVRSPRETVGRWIWCGRLPVRLLGRAGVVRESELRACAQTHDTELHAERTRAHRARMGRE